MSQQTKTLLVILLDQSASMGKRKVEMIQAFNDLLEQQKLLETDSARVLFIKFNSKVEIVQTGVPLNDVEKLTINNYQPDGNTALYDAVLTGISYADESKFVDEKVLFVIITDGEENSSKHADETMIRLLMTDYKAKDDWKFIYHGVNPLNWSRKTGMDVVDCTDFDFSYPENSMASLSGELSQRRMAQRSDTPVPEYEMNIQCNYNISYIFC